PWSRGIHISCSTKEGFSELRSPNGVIEVSDVPGWTIAKEISLPRIEEAFQNPRNRVVTPLNVTGDCFWHEREIGFPFRAIQYGGFTVTEKGIAPLCFGRALLFGRSSNAPELEVNAYTVRVNRLLLLLNILVFGILFAAVWPLLCFVARRSRE